MPNNKIKTTLIAPCGMNCALCLGYQRKKNKCPGCRNRKLKCHRRDCKERTGKFCYECKKFPCASIKRLDERYEAKYNMSEIANLKYIQKYGLEKFIRKEEKKWQCKKCKALICVHKNKCLHCEKNK